MDKIKIMFVCMGNICRSPLAHAVFDYKTKEQKVDKYFETESSGTIAYHIGENADPRMRSEAKKNGIIFNHYARQFKIADFKKYDFILAMDNDNFYNIKKLATENTNLLTKLHLYRDWDPEASKGAEVPDPYYGGSKGFEKVYEIVERTTKNLINELLKNNE